MFLITISNINIIFCSNLIKNNNSSVKNFFANYDEAEDFKGLL